MVLVVLAAQERDMIKCPKCEHDKSLVLETRYEEQWNQSRRTRVCKSCGARFRTYENVDDDGVEG